MKIAAITLCIAALAGCAAPGDRVTAPFADLDSNTQLSVSDKPDGFLVAIVYSRYQFVPNAGPIALDCRSILLSAARTEADKRGRKVQAFDEQRIQMGTNRNILTGSTTCVASLPVVWS